LPIQLPQFQRLRRGAGENRNRPGVLFTDLDLALPFGNSMNETAPAGNFPFILQVKPAMFAEPGGGGC